MKFTKLLTVAVVVLLAMNIFLGITLYSQRKDKDSISDKTVDETVSLLKASGVEIDAELIPKENTEYQIFQFDYASDNESYYSKIASLFISGETELYMTENGVRISEKDGLASVEFSEANQLYVEYSAKGDYDYCREKVTELLLSDYDLSTAPGLEYVDKLNTLLGFTDEGGDNLYLRLNGIKYNPEYDVTLVEWQENFGNYILDDADGCVLFDENGELCYFEGIIVTGKYEKQLSADLYDVINVLFDEKSESGGENVEVKEIGVRYYPQILSDTGKIYLIPAYSIYTDKDIHVRSMLDGKLK